MDATTNPAVPFVESIIGIMILYIVNFTLGSVIDLFTMFAGTIGISTIPMKEAMQSVMFFGSSAYFLITVAALLGVIQPFIFLYARHKYGDVKTKAYEEVY